MTKKDYVLIADILNKWTTGSMRALLAVEFCRAFQAENPRFDAAKWHKALRSDQ